MCNARPAAPGASARSANSSAWKAPPIQCANSTSRKKAQPRAGSFEQRARRMLLQFATLFGSLLCFAGGVAAFIIWRRQHGALEMQDRLVDLTQAGPDIERKSTRRNSSQ